MHKKNEDCVCARVCGGGGGFQLAQLIESLIVE